MSEATWRVPRPKNSRGFSPARRRRSPPSTKSVSPSSKRTQRFLHAYPTVVPFVVLLLGVLLGVLVNPSRFTAASNFSTILTQVMVIGIVGVGQTLVILTAGIDLSVGVIMVISSVVMGRLAVYNGVPTFIAFPIGLLVGARLRLSQRHSGDAAQDAAVHRHARHAQHHRRAQHVLFAERNHRHAGYRGEGLVPADHGQSDRNRRRAHHAGHASCCSRSQRSSGTSSTAPPTAATSTPPATTARPRGSRASTPTASCSAFTCSPALSRRSPAGR